MGFNQRSRDTPLVRNIVGLIKATHTTQKAVAEAAGITEQTFSRKLTTRPGAFTYKELGGIAHALGTTVSQLIGDDVEAA